MSKRVTPVYVLQNGKDTTLGKPKVSIGRTSSGAITFEVSVSARSVKQAREKAEEAFRELEKFAQREGATK